MSVPDDRSVRTLGLVPDRKSKSNSRLPTTIVRDLVLRRNPPSSAGATIVMHEYGVDVRVERFRNATAGDSLAALWRLAVSTGMRRGEMRTRRWAEVDLDRGEVAVHRTLTRCRDGLMFGEPKPAKGRRSIALPQSCVNALRVHRIEQAKRRLKLGPLRRDTDLVFDGEMARSCTEA